MKRHIFLIPALSLALVVGCASPPAKERVKFPSRVTKPAESPPPREKLEEIVILQKEELKKVPEKLYTFSARDANVQDVLLAFSKETEFNIVIDPELSGKVTIDLKRVTLKEALDAILSPIGWTYRVKDKFIKVSRLQMETRLFTLNYIATRRTGKRETYASIRGEGQTNVLVGQQMSTAGTTGGKTGFSDLISTDEVDLWNEIQKGLETIVFEGERGKSEPASPDKATWVRADGSGKKLVVNKTTGVIMVTDFPANLNRIASYLETVEGSSQRQVFIQAKIVEVILSDENKEGINWNAIQSLPRSINFAFGLTNKAGTVGFPGGSTGYFSDSSTSGTVASLSTPGTFKIKPFGGIFAIGSLGTEILLSDIMTALAQQGDVKVLSSPTISTLNNQKAIIKVGDQDVFFLTGTVATESNVIQTFQPMTIDIGIILDVTPQIAEDGTIMMSIHPSITDKTGERTAPDGTTTFPILSVRETDTTVKVQNGQTIIIAGLMQERKEKTYVGLPILDSTPVIGGLFRYRTETTKKSELVIMITPTLQIGKRVEELTNK